MLMSVLTAWYDTISQVLRRHVEKRSLFDHMDALMLIVDEIIDGGYVTWVNDHMIQPHPLQCNTGD